MAPRATSPRPTKHGVGLGGFLDRSRPIVFVATLCAEECIDQQGSSSKVSAPICTGMFPHGALGDTDRATAHRSQNPLIGGGRFDLTPLFDHVGPWSCPLPEVSGADSPHFRDPYATIAALIK